MGKSILAVVIPGLLATVTWAEVQIPPGFEIVHITDNPNDYSNRPEINNCGETVFSKRINQSEPGEEIFLYDNGRLIRLTEDDVRDAFADINDEGTIVWTRGADGYGGGTIVMYRDGTVTEIATGSSPEINNLGHVAWKLFTPVSCAWPSDIFLYDGETIQQITDDGLSNQVVGINDADELVWTRWDFCSSPWGQDIMFYSGGVTERLTDGQHRPASPRINDLSQIVWASRDPRDSHRYVELWEDGVTVTVVDPGSGELGVNNAGEIVFLREGADLQGNQIWLYRDGALFEVTDNPFSNYDAGINEEGELVWQAKRFPESDIYFLRRIRTGEADFDGDVALDDFAVFQNCMTGPGDYDHLCACRFLDLDRDRDVDLGDFALFQNLFTGENS